MYQCINNRQGSDHKSLMAVNWDLIINVVVIGTIIIVFLSKMLGMKISEMFNGIRDFITDSKDEAVEKSEDLVYYE